MNIKVLIHGGEQSAMLKIVRSQAFVDHVVVQSVEEFNVDVAHQGIQNFLQHILKLHLAYLDIFAVFTVRIFGKSTLPNDRKLFISST